MSAKSPRSPSGRDYASALVVLLFLRLVCPVRVGVGDSCGAGTSTEFHLGAGGTHVLRVLRAQILDDLLRPRALDGLLLDQLVAELDEIGLVLGDDRRGAGLTLDDDRV